MLKSKLRLFSRRNLKLYEYICFIGIAGAIIIALYVLFYPPMPGVADQGDFQRVMSVTGLDEITQKSSSDPHWYKYVTTEYKYASLKLYRLIGIVPTTSMIYPITLARELCKLIGRQFFSTRMLAAVYAVMYISGLYMCIKWIRPKRLTTGIFFVILSVFILMDGNYIIWFNSLYGEPMMMVGLILFIASVLYVCAHMEEHHNKGVFFVFTGALLFLGAKLQCFVALPLIGIVLVRLALLQKKSCDRGVPLRALVLLLAIYVGGIYVQLNNSCGVDTKYNSVFYGVLKTSDNPKKDLAVLGLPSDMAVDAGKHAYLPKEQYAKYVPWSDVTEKEFNQKISNFKLLKFYMLQPNRLIKGMEYTASQCFDTQGFLGKYEESAVKEYTYTFSRFTLWSEFRNSKLPKKIYFIIPFYVFVIAISVVEYLRRKDNIKGKLHIELLWVIVIISLLQFPMPYIGNGEADTQKQLFLFNYTFDIIFLVACTWLFDKMAGLLRINYRDKN